MKSVGKAHTQEQQSWPPVETVALRTRPGDRPTWLRLGDDPVTEELRAIASAHDLPVDVVAALVAEWRLCEPLIGAERQAAVVAAASAAMTEARLIPHPELRAWERMLAGRDPGAGGDELPELCLPQRIGHRLPQILARHHLPLERLPDATLCDRAACRFGMTMEAWMLATALAHPACP